MRYTLLFILTLFGTAFASQPRYDYDYVVHEPSTARFSTDWVKASRLDSDHMLPMSIGLGQQNLDKLDEMLMSVSHPDSPTYSQHFTATELVDIFAPSEETISAVTEWLIDSGISHDRLRLSRTKGWIHLDALTSEVEELFRTEYHVFVHPSGAMKIGCHQYLVPRGLRQHIDVIKPTIAYFNNPEPTANNRIHHSPFSTLRHTGHPMMTNPSWTHSLANCSHQITPSCLRALYNFYYTPQSTERNSFAIAEFTPKAILFSDLSLYFNKFLPSRVGETPRIVSVDGGILQTNNRSRQFNGESSLDLQYGMTLTDPQTVTLLQIGDEMQSGSFNNMLHAMDESYCGGEDPTLDGIYPDTAPGGFNGPPSCGITEVPYVLSVSYGSNEADMPFSYMQRQCQEYGKLGLMGLTVFFGSGDSGVAGAPVNNTALCLNSTHQGDPNGDIFNPDFPATCPYVTAVGATQMVPGSTVLDPEIVATFSHNNSNATSGGGFSNFFALPDYQKYAVQQYSEKYLTPSPFRPGQYNDSGNVRAYPDLSANGLNYSVVVDGNFSMTGGTSASTPVVASMFTMINDARLSKGKRPVGFINPAIYSPYFAAAFNDITKGHNPGCGTQGFYATRGWDPVTGLGTPNFEKLLKRFMELP